MYNTEIEKPMASKLANKDNTIRLRMNSRKKLRCLKSKSRLRSLSVRELEAMWIRRLKTLTIWLKTKKKSRIRRSNHLRRTKMRLTERRKKMRTKPPECINLFNKK
jgi:cytidylate kinase